MNIRKIRKATGLTQAQFWHRVGITQSGGSRYEGGRNIPKPVRILLHISYGTVGQSQAAMHKLRPRYLGALR